MYKQKGEEYRLHGTGGWYWLHAARKVRTKSHRECGLAAQRDTQAQCTKLKYRTLLKDHLKDRTLVENLLNEDDIHTVLGDTMQPWFNNTLHPYLQTIDIDLIDITDNLLSRKLYPKEMPNKSKYLDSLLDKREQAHKLAVNTYDLLVKDLETKLYDDEKKARGDDQQQPTVADNDDDMTMRTKCKDQVHKLIEHAKQTKHGEHIVDYNGETIKLPCIDNNTSFKYELNRMEHNRAEKVVWKKLPPSQKFLINGKSTMFLFPREVTRLIARKGGFRMEVPGFKHENHKPSTQWPYPCSRPLLKTCWAYKTHTAPNLAAIAMQLKYFWCCLRWDAVNERPPNNSISYQGGNESMLTEHLDNCIQTMEIIRKRNIGLYQLRSDYQIRKKRMPYNYNNASTLSTKKSKKQKQQRDDGGDDGESSLLNISCGAQSSRNNTPNARRSGLRQLTRQSSIMANEMDTADNNSNISVDDTNSNTDEPNRTIVSVVAKEPDTCEEWVNEERLHLWQIKSFYERTKRIEIDAIRAKEKQLKLQQQRQAAANLVASTTTHGNKSTTGQLQQRTVASHLSQLTPTTPTNNAIRVISSQQTTPSSPQSILTPIRVQAKPAVLTTTRVVQGSPLVASSTIYVQKPAAQLPPTTTTCAQQTTQIKSQSSINLNLNSTGGARIVRLANGQYVQLSIAKSTTQTTGTTATLTTTTTSTQIIHTIRPPSIVPNGAATILTTPTAKVITKYTSCSPSFSHQQGTTGKPPTESNTTILGNLTMQHQHIAEHQPKYTAAPLAISKQQQQQSHLTPVIVRSQDVKMQSITPITVKSQEEHTKQESSPQSESSPIGDNGTASAGTRVQRRRKLPSKFNDTYELLYDGDDNAMKTNMVSSLGTTPASQRPRAKPKSIQTLISANELAQKLAGGCMPATVVPANHVDTLEDVENRLKKKRLDLLRWNKEDLRAYMKHKRTYLEADLVECIRLDIELEEYAELKMRYTMDQLAALTATTLAAEKQQQPTGTSTTDQNDNSVNSTKDGLVRHDDTPVANKRPSRLRKSNIIEPTGVEQVATQQPVTTTTTTGTSQNCRKRKAIGGSQPVTEEHTTAIHETKTDKKKQIDAAPTIEATVCDENVNVIKRPKTTTIITTHCLCNSPYDKNRFEVQCNVCTSWFHGDCVDMKPNAGTTLYTCDKCKATENHNHNTNRRRSRSYKSKRTTLNNTDIHMSQANLPTEIIVRNDGQLFCICQRPYDDRLFYIGCDICLDWYHGACVGIFQLESVALDTYVCPKCLQKQGKEWVLERKVNLKNLELMKNIVYTVRVSICFFSCFSSSSSFPACLRSCYWSTRSKLFSGHIGNCLMLLKLKYKMNMNSEYL